MTKPFTYPRGGWTPAQARSIPGTWWSVEKSLNPQMPVRVSMFVGIFFEETGCCNMVQDQHPFAIGPGQLQLSDYPQRHFVAGQTARKEMKENGLGGVWDSSQMLKSSDKGTPVPVRPGLKPLTRDMVLSDFDFSVALSTKMFEWEWKGYGVSGKQYTSESALVSIGQLGGQSAEVRRTALQAFTQCANDLDALVREKPVLPFGPDGSLPASFYETRRRRFAEVLNRPRALVREPHTIPYSGFEEFWKFMLPDGFIENPSGYLLLGF